MQSAPPPADPVEQILSLLRGITDRGDERKIIDLLATMATDDLRRTLTTIDLNWLVGDVDDHFFGPKHREELIHRLTDERLADLDVACKERLLNAIQRRATTLWLETGARRILCGTTGAELFALKRAIDARGTEQDLGKLLYDDIDNQDIRAEILAHFAAQAAERAARELKVVSDIDDTFYANWRDKRYPEKTVYPGVLQVFAEIDRGPKGDDPEGDILFVTARPEDGLGLVERATRKTLGIRGATNIAVFTGNLGSIFGSRVIASKKLNNFENITNLYPEADFVLFGDTGQGDVAFGRAAKELANERVRAGLMHDVVDTPEGKRKALRERGIVLFDTYIGAALHLFDAGLISEEGLRRVRHIAWDELALVPFLDSAVKAGVSHLFEVDDERVTLRLDP